GGMLGERILEPSLARRRAPRSVVARRRLGARARSPRAPLRSRRSAWAVRVVQQRAPAAVLEPVVAAEVVDLALRAGQLRPVLVERGLHARQMRDPAVCRVFGHEITIDGAEQARRAAELLGGVAGIGHEARGVLWSTTPGARRTRRVRRAVALAVRRCPRRRPE